MRHPQLFSFFIFHACISLNAQTASTPILTKSPFVLGETLQIYSGQLHENRVLNIYLPAAYEQDSAGKYPVIYLLDGSADEDFIHIAGLVQFATFPWVNALPESIVVGIANVDRKRDFTFPSRQAGDLSLAPTSGGSAAFIRFMETELKPFIARQYRTDTVATLIGQSLGGLLASEILLKKPDLFTHYIIVSPSLWWDKESLLQLEPKAAGSAKSVYLAAGKDEEADMVRATLALSGKLRKNNSGNMRPVAKILEGQNHGNILHMAVYDAFEQLFKTEKR